MLVGPPLRPGLGLGLFEVVHAPNKDILGGLVQPTRISNIKGARSLPGENREKPDVRVLCVLHYTVRLTVSAAEAVSHGR